MKNKQTEMERKQENKQTNKSERQTVIKIVDEANTREEESKLK